MTAVRANPAATIGLALVTTAVVLVPLTLIGLWLASTQAGAAGLDPTFGPAGTGPATRPASPWRSGAVASSPPWHPCSPST